MRPGRDRRHMPRRLVIKKFHMPDNRNSSEPDTVTATSRNCKETSTTSALAAQNRSNVPTTGHISRWSSKPRRRRPKPYREAPGYDTAKQLLGG